MKAFNIAALLKQHAAAGKLYLEFLREPSMSLGIYILPAGATDPQQPHQEDEVYYILHGRGQIMVDGEDQPIQPGSIVFVGKQVEHRFHTITEDLHILVFFAPAESTVP